MSAPDGKPSEYYVVWEESVDAGSLAWATRIARQKVREGKAAVQVRRRVGQHAYADHDGTHWYQDGDELVQDAL